jgi:hypothetical protein
MRAVTQGGIWKLKQPELEPTVVLYSRVDYGICRPRPLAAVEDVRNYLQSLHQGIYIFGDEAGEL